MTDTACLSGLQKIISSLAPISSVRVQTLSTHTVVTDRSQEGMQFCKGFGGIGGILRYKVAFEELAMYEEDEEEFMSDDDEDY